MWMGYTFTLKQVKGPAAWLIQQQFSQYQGDLPPLVPSNSEVLVL